MKAPLVAFALMATLSSPARGAAAPVVEMSFRQLYCLEVEDVLFSREMELRIRVRGRDPAGRKVSRTLEKDCMKGSVVFNAKKPVRLWRGTLPPGATAWVDVRIDELDEGPQIGMNENDYAGGFRLTVENRDGTILKKLETYKATRHAGTKDKPAFSESNKTVRMRMDGEGDLLAGLNVIVDGELRTWARREIHKRPGKPLPAPKPQPAATDRRAEVASLTFEPSHLTAGEPTTMTVCVVPTDRTAVVEFTIATPLGITSTLNDTPSWMELAPGVACGRQVLRTVRRVDDRTVLIVSAHSKTTRSATLTID